MQIAALVCGVTWFRPRQPVPDGTNTLAPDGPTIFRKDVQSCPRLRLFGSLSPP
jgi:hypothetical protein